MNEPKGRAWVGVAMRGEAKEGIRPAAVGVRRPDESADDRCLTAGGRTGVGATTGG